ncbi:MAG TPA: DUF2807 domain-containing protein [Reyranella sp.]|nr:DUF2807 domain-containing protein [Reyranella sp.]
MTRTLAWTAAAGLGGGIVLLLIAFSLGGRELVREARWGGWHGAGWRGEACAQADDKDSPSERHWSWNGGDVIDVAGPGLVRLHAGQGNEIIARGPAAALSAIEFHDGRMVIRCASPGLDIALPDNGPRRFNVSGPAKVVMDGLAQRDLELRVSGSGDVDASGSIDHATVSVAGSGNARLGNVTMKVLTAHISGSGGIEAAPTELADIRISGAGVLRLRSHPATLRSHISGSGRITQTAALDPK